MTRLKLTVAAALGALAAACASLPAPELPRLWGRDDRAAPAVAPAAPATTAPSIAAFAHPPLSAPALMAHIETLASDAFAGRPTIDPYQELTLSYIETAFAQAGLSPGAPQPDGTMGWRQPVQLLSAEVMGAPPLTIAGPDGAANYGYRYQHVVWTKRRAPEVALQDAPLVFVGYGIHAPERGWDDYAGIDMRGRVAVILINDPDFDTGDDRGFGGRAMTYYGRWTYKFEEAARQGAAGALIIHEDAAAAYPWSVVTSSWTGPQFSAPAAADAPERPLVEGWINQQTAQEVFRRAGLDLNALRARAQSPGARPVELTGLTASIRVQSTLGETVSANVVGVLPGLSAPQEAVLYTAHWDHLGFCSPVNGDAICNGAADNASGVAGLIELARRFASMGRTPRSVGFIAFTAEEQGLIGAASYARDPIFAPRDTAAVINMDNLNVFGATRSITVTGYGQTDLEDRLAEAAASQNRTVAPEAYPERGGFYRSDHFELAKLGVPVLYARGGVDLVNGGEARGRALSQDYITRRYHAPDDEITEDWDLFGASQDLQLFYTIGRAVATEPGWPQWRSQSEFRPIRERQGR